MKVLDSAPDFVPVAVVLSSQDEVKRLYLALDYAEDTFITWKDKEYAKFVQ